MNKQEQERRGKEEKSVHELADRLRVPYVDLYAYPIDRELVQSMPVEFLHRMNFIPLEDKGGTVRIAVTDPSDLGALDVIESFLDKKVEIAVASRSAVLDALRRCETAMQVLKEATEGFATGIVEAVPEDEEEVLSIEKLAEQQDGGSIIKLLNTIIITAVQKRASDIHIESRDRDVRVKFRVDGVLGEAMKPIDKKFQGPMISRIKVMSELDIAERRVPQDGRFRLRIKDKTIDFRVSIMPCIYGEDAVIRILDKEMITEAVSELRLDMLGFSETVKKKFRRYIAQPYGMVLVTGPTGSGKTTTLYAALTEIKSPEDKIVTIEDPVEYQVDGVVQIPVNEKKGLTFARGLRSILRHDPDKIMVGEIRDPETAQIAIQSALTGHLVFTTVHANNVVDVIGRFLHMQVDPYSFISALNCILAQRLIRVLCPSCKRPVAYSPEVLKESGLEPEAYRGAVFYEPAGCGLCGGTGYKGRTAIAEILELSDPIRELILSKRPLSEVRKKAREEGMSFLRESGLEKVVTGVTSLKDLNKVTFVD